MSVLRGAALGAVLLVGLAACTSAKAVQTESRPAGDVDAARACQAFVDYSTGKGTGPELIDAVSPLLAGAAEARVKGVAMPKWADLGGTIVVVAADMDRGDPIPATPDGNKIIAECGAIPAAAKAAGGYTR